MLIKSPKDIPFGIENWSYGEVRPTSVTFFLDGRALVCDHRGNSITSYSGTHAEVVAKLLDDGFNWQKLDYAGWPQLPYEELKKIEVLPPTPLDELMTIKDRALRADAVRMRQEADAEATAAAEEEEAA